MIISTKVNKAMLGYALWIAIEDALRNWLARKLIELYGPKWDEQFPTGIWNKLAERYGQKIKPSDFSKVRELLEHSDFPDLFDIVKYRKKSKDFLPAKHVEELDYYAEKLYTLRNLIAHKPNSFNVRSIDDLTDCSEWVISLVGPDSVHLAEVKSGIQNKPELYAREIPAEFIERTKQTSNYKITNNLPAMDYEADGGFVGRREERQNLKRRLLDKKLHPIITVSGAGGVGKTALAHYVCEDILSNSPEAFDAVVWISAKKDKLTLTGIEEIEPTAQSFEEVLDAILSTIGFSEYVEKSVEEKQTIVQEIVLDDKDYSILLVIDNLETILHDKTLIEYIKEIPLPHKILITSRLGLGEIERRFPLAEMTDGDAIELFRRIAIEKSVKGLAQLPNETIRTYVHRMNSYPLVIKWVVGQAALGKDIERLVQTINTTDSDISKFCFEYIYDHLLSDNAKLVLRCLAASEQELTQPVLMHVAELGVQAFEEVMLELELASLVIPDQQKAPTSDDRIITKYSILPLTRGFISSKEGSSREIKAKLQSVQNLAEDARKAKRQYELSLEYLGAETDGELIASKHVQTAFTRNQAGDYAGAIEAIERAKEIAPNFASVYRSWAVIEADNKNYDKAIDLFEKATQIKADDPTTWFHWGNLEKNLANYSNARRYLNRALELVENTASVLIALGNVEKQDSNFTKAIEILDEVISDLEATHTTITDRELIVASTSLADTYYRWAEAYERDNQIDFAVEKATSSYEIMNKVAALGSNDAKTRETRMKCLLLLGRLHNKKNNPSAARHFLEEIISMEMNPRIWSWDQRRYVARACYLLIPVLLDEGEMEHATSVYEHGLYCMAPDDYIKSKYERLGTLLQEAKKRYQGVFVRVVAERGFGFIDCREVSEDAIFAHLYDIVDEIGDDFSAMINVWVSFSIEKTEKGLAAKGIRILH